MARDLRDSPSIADFATGTGAFLHSLSESYPGARLDGYDISPAIFRPGKNVNLSVANAKEPIPAELHGVYDIVHIRYLAAGMEPDDWEPVLRNMLQLLKPGGAIQWEEGALSQLQYLRGEPSSMTATLKRASLTFLTGTMQRRFSYGWNTLPEIMEKCGLRVETDVVSSDRVVETRRAITENSLVALLGFARMMAAKEAPGAMATAEIEEMEDAAIKEIESGCYVRYDIHTAVGFKPNGIE